MSRACTCELTVERSFSMCKGRDTNDVRFLPLFLARDNMSHSVTERRRKTHRQHIDKKVEHIAFADGSGNVCSIQGAAIGARSDEKRPRRQFGDED